MMEQSIDSIIMKINGQQVSGKSGQTIMQVARDNDISIPSLCDSPHLDAFGSCRMCIVEVDGMQGTPSSCTTLASEGMEIETGSERLWDLRKGITELYVSEHPLDCLTCTANGDCELQDVAAEVGLREVRYDNTPANIGMPIDFSNPFFSFDASKCIVCSRCVRACDDVQVTHALSIDGRGFDSRIIAGADETFMESDCVSCGACVNECPVGALEDTVERAAGVPDNWVRTTCAFCGVGCQFDVGVKGGKLVTMQPAADSPVNQGHACVKGRFASAYVHHEDRLTVPLLRESIEDEFREVSWDEAYQFIADGWTKIKAESGPDAIGAITSSRSTNELNYLGAKLMRAVIGTNNVDNCARVCHSATVKGMMTVFGAGAGTNSLEDIDVTDLLLASGCNPIHGHPVTGSRIKRARKRGMKMIVADPKKTLLAKMSDIHLQLRPGTNVALYQGLSHIIIRDGLEAGEDWMNTRTENLKPYKEMCARMTPDICSTLTGIPVDTLEAAAKMYATSSAAMSVHGLGMTEHSHGSEGVMALSSLALLTGNVGRPGTGINPLRGQNNVQGSCDMGALPNVYTNYQAVDNEENRSAFSEVWKVEAPAKAGLTYPEMLQTVGDQDGVRSLYMIGSDIAHTDPDSDAVKRAMANLDLLIVQDIFFCESAKFAHVVLPAASFLESDGTYTNGERRIQRIRKAIDSPGIAKEDWIIVAELAKKMGHDILAGPTPSDVWDELAGLTPNFKGINYTRLETPQAVQWPSPTEDHPGTTVMHQEKFSRGLGNFAAPEFSEPNEQASDDYPFILVTGRNLFHYNAGTQTRRSDLVKFRDTDYLEIHIKDARRLGINDGDEVWLSSPRNRIKMAAKVGDTVRIGNLFTTFHFPEVGVNSVLSASADGYTHCPEYKVQAVSIEKV
ncbi:MAG: formate dehydrogenase subunit alpha [Euryarchaeota archaeon]|jgi:formate dehydrogenase major subunit|nr:formate dehydrogenase subunit alpha [Euryarchaeota archaeon]MBT3757604.1 formate dehydrogenase subunit alpha [Euryarchaeota archaeon]MBT4050884.1 formate dehydrogenase subunit alpha [Euryarchaeota archaeon]MBT4347142.1 formate dehydrogenase subunit alpha [Euryarchaeota archaeon]MBT4649615.1 formate dehydrogenase subunit alpha [Euryarchaeota archaeon]|tara:strand:+ start:4416 stop:7130 length:2715 start_codon:yes stop_codon:yes gene_type:complete